MIKVTGECLGFEIGKQYEHIVDHIPFDFSPWFEEFGEGNIVLTVLRPTDTIAYPVALDVDGTVATWTVTATDTAYKGMGKAQLSYLVGEAVKKSIVYSIIVIGSIEATEDPPDPYQTWLDRAIEAETNAINAKNDAIQAKNDAEAAAVVAQTATQYEDDGDGNITIRREIENG